MLLRLFETLVIKARGFSPKIALLRTVAFKSSKIEDFFYKNKIKERKKIIEIMIIDASMFT